MMKKIFLYSALAMLLACGISSCDEKWEIPNEKTDTQGYGTLSTNDMLVDVTNAEKVIKRSTDVDLSNFIITVTKKTTGDLVAKWIYSDMPGLPTFEVGEYTLKVESMALVKCDWDAPYFVGTKDFEILKDQITKVGTVTCKLQNLKVTVVFEADLVKASAGDLKCVISTISNGTEGDGLTFTPEETRAGYFELVDGNISMIAEFTGTVNGYKEGFVEAFSDIKAGEHHIITFRLRESDWNLGDPAGGINLGSINVDMSVVNHDMTGNISTGDEGVISGNRPGKEEWPDNPDDPTPAEEVIKFSSDYLDLGEGAVNIATRFGTEEWGDDLLPAVVVIAADNGVKNLNVNINSVGLDVTEVGLTNSFDLANPGNLETALKGLKFPVGAEVVNQKIITFDISEFVPLLPNFEGPHVFYIEIVDIEMNKKTLVLTFVNE